MQTYIVLLNGSPVAEVTAESPDHAVAIVRSALDLTADVKTVGDIRWLDQAAEAAPVA